MTQEKYALEIALENKPVGIHSVYIGESKEGDWHRDDWSCTLEYQGRTMRIDYHMGIGHRVFPEHLPNAAYANGGIRVKSSNATKVMTAGEYSKRYAGKTYQPPVKMTREFAIVAEWAQPVPPTAIDVLNACLSDASAIDLTFENWCSELGFDPDSRKAERIYNQCIQQTIQLKQLLGGDFGHFIENNEY